mgnify:CR=1 FL=1
MDFSLEIITPKGIYLQEKVTSLTVKLTSGYRTFLAGHAPLIGSLDYAPGHILKDGKVEYYAILGGAINVTKDKVIVICNAIENAKDIDVSRATESKERAEERIKAKDSNVDIKRARLALARALARLKTAESK